MDGSHNPVRRAQTSLNPGASSASYQVNVRRNKTRKWVEAKVQNYDGDDWGADEYDDEEEESDHDSAPTPPPINPSLRTFTGTDLLHSRRNTPSPASSLSALPSLRSQLPQPPAVPPASESPRSALASPGVSDLSIRSDSDSVAVSPQSVGDERNNQSLGGISQLPSQVQQHQQGPSGGFNVSRTSSFEQAVKPASTTPPVAGDRFMTPPQNSATSPSPPPPADQLPPVIYSPDNYSRLADDDEDRSMLALAPATTAGSDQGAFVPAPLAREDTRDTWERDEEPSSHADELPSSLGVLHPDLVESQVDRGRMSVSPKLPDLSRMSAFGTDLFSLSASNSIPKEAVIDEVPGNTGEDSATADPPAVDYNQTTAEAKGQDYSEVSGGALFAQSADLHPGRNMPSIPPLRTPSPHEPRAAVPMFDSQETKITPTEPLQPGRTESLAEIDNPQQFQAMQAYSTSTESPVKDSPLKENDVLSDEIMRTLSPSGVIAAEAKPLSEGGPRLHPAEDRSAVRESSYTLGDYDSYWADAAAAAGSDDAPEQSSENLATQQSAQEQQQGEETQDLQDPHSSLRRRFSWEDEQRTPMTQAQIPTPLAAAPPADYGGSSAPVLHLTAPSGQALEPSVTNLSIESRSHSPVSQLSQAPPAGSGVGSAPLALQTSVPGQDSSLPEPPSPVSVSVLSDKPSTTAHEQARQSIADEKPPLADRGSVSLETATPPRAESHAAVSSPTSAASVPAPQTPVHNAALPQAKAMNFKDIMALSTTSERIGKYGEARQILAARDSGLDTWLVHMMTEHPDLPASRSVVPGQTSSQLTNSSAMPAASQASGQQQSPSSAGPQSGARSRLGGLSMPSQMSGSALSHSGKEIGNKSKEFMHSAGKMGKGLLSKGKSKLRGSGDKVDAAPPDHPAPHKPHRRSTWRFSLEPKPQDDAAPHSVETVEITPQLPDPSPISPLNAASGPGSAFPWAVEDDDFQRPDVSPVKEFGVDDDEHVRLDELVIANSFLPVAYASAQHEDALFPADANLDVVTPDDWVMVQHQGEQSRAQRMSMSHRAMATTHEAAAAAGANAPQQQTQTQTQQPQSGPEAPQRNSSFIGLPPIRRGSTFGPKPKARRAAERFSLDEDDDDDIVEDAAGADGFNNGVYPPAETAMNTNKALPLEPMQGVPLPTAVNFSQGQPPNAGRQYQQQYPGVPNPQFAQVSAPVLSSLVQKPPPTGSWKLEESHLAAPLQVTKKRSGTDIAQQFVYSAYDKETGLEYPAAPMPPAQGPPGRFRSDVPPSSARRYPDLFSLSPAQDPRQQQQHTRGQGFPPPQMQQGRPPRDGAAGARQQQQQQQQGAPDSPASGMATDDRGRRRNSGIFRDIGTRLARATSRERRSSVSDAARPRGDGMSEASVATEDASVSDRKKKRASFFGLAGRPISADQPPRNQAGAEVPADGSHEERKRSLFGGKIGPGNFSRSSTSNSAFEQGAGPGGEANPQKRRISDIAKASGIAGLFSRARQERSSLVPMPMSQQSVDQRQASQTTIQAPPMQLPSLDFASDPLESMSSLGFEESFPDYRHEAQPPQKHFANSHLGFSPPDSSINPQVRAVSPLSNILSAHEEAAASSPPMNEKMGQGNLQIDHYLVAGDGSLEEPAMDEKTPKLQDFMFQEKMAALQLDGLDDNVSEEEISRSQTVSPDISISSNLKAEEGQHSPERNEILITPPLETSLPAPPAASAVAKDLPPSIHSFASVSSLRAAKSAQPEESLVQHRTKEEEVAISRQVSPQVTKSDVSSKATTPASEHQQLHSPALVAVKLPETQNAEPPATPRSQVRLEARQNPEIQAQAVPQQGPEQRPASQQRLPLAPVQRQPPLHAQVSVPMLQQRPQYPPSVSVSNASIASEASTPVFSTQQQSGSQNPFPGVAAAPARRAFTQFPDTPAVQPKESQGSRWKGFRSRVTEQVSQKAQPQQQQQSQSKNPVGEKSKGNKLLGALRRTSKQPELVQTHSLEPSPGSRQLPHQQPPPQGYQPQPGQLQGQRLPGDQHMQQHVQQHVQQQMQPPALPRAKTMPPGAVQQPGMPSSEPRYESVPIPRGYAAVYGEGRVVPSPYQPNPRQQMPHGQFAPVPPHMQQQQQQQQQHLHPQQQWQGVHPLRMNYYQYQPQPQPAQYFGGQQSPPMAQGPVSAPLPQERPMHMRFPSDPRSDYFNSQSPNSLSAQHNRHHSQSSQSSRGGLPRPSSDLGSPKASERDSLPVVDGRRSVSKSPAVSVGADQKPETRSDKTAESASSLGIDIEKAQQQLEEDDLYSATPRKLEDGVQQPTVSRTMTNEQAAESSASGAVKRSNTVVAELEDTEKARKRAIRLASQEEKIFYEPEDEAPKMSATSYPGQEWNPFGEQEFADWREE
ncbi:hypothetical protein ACQKWADRAFT_312654 [Trichoderma austrokoningii]